MRHFFQVLGVAVVLLGSCKNNSYVLPEKQMVDVLVDMHLAEGTLYQVGGKFKSTEEKLAVYNWVYQKHGISKERLDSSINYYTYYADGYNRIYTEVVSRLEKMNEMVLAGEFIVKNELSFNDLSKNLKLKDSALKDSVVSEIWKLQREYKLPQEGSKRILSYDFENDTSSRFSFAVLLADIILYHNDCSQNPTASLNFLYDDDTKSTIEIPLKKNALNTKLRLRLECEEGKLVKRIYGNLVGHDKCLSNKNLKASDIRLYKMEYPDTGGVQKKLLDMSITPLPEPDVILPKE